MPTYHTSAAPPGEEAGRIGKTIWDEVHATSSLELTVCSASPSASQNDYSPTGWDGAHPDRATVLRLTPTATILITGLAGGTSGRLARVENDSSDYMVVLVPQSTLSVAANRFAHPSRVPVFLLPGDWADYLWDSADQRWELISSSRHGSLAAQFDGFDDFFALTGAFGTSVSGTGASGQTGAYLVNSTEKPAGVYQVDTGTTATGRAQIGSSSNNSIVPRQGPALYLTRLAVEALSNGTERYHVFAGFHDASGATNVTDGVYWAYRDDVNANWLRGSAAASTRTESDGGVAVDTNYIWLGIFLNADWTRADFFFSTDSVTWTLAGSNSANMPSASQLVGLGNGIVKSVGTTQRNLSNDLLGWRYDIQRG
jgi:hypothetical protein